MTNDVLVASIQGRLDLHVMKGQIAQISLANDAGFECPPAGRRI